MPQILVHGGAGRHPEASRDAKRLGVRRAADAGWAVLEAGGSALDAVEAATRVLEADPLFDAGRGSYPNRDGVVEVDAVIMDGANLDFGAVAAVPLVLHAVTLARRVLAETPHGLLVADGALDLARRSGLTVPATELLCDEALAVWQARRLAAAAPDGGGTVGAVARDAAGHLAAATSTGGTCNKWSGRVGDTPIVGAGAYADDEAGAVSCTGHGESILKLCLAHDVARRLEGGADAMAAAQAGIRRLGARTGGEGGLIVLGADGRLGWAWNTDAMPYAWRDGTGGGDGL